MSVAFQRGRQRFWVTLGRLALGPALVTVLNLVLLLAIAQFAQSLLLGFVSNTLAYFIGFIPLHLTAIALSLAYSETEQMQNESLFD